MSTFFKSRARFFRMNLKSLVPCEVPIKIVNKPVVTSKIPCGTSSFLAWVS